MPFSFGSSVFFCYKKRQNIPLLLTPPVLAAWILLLCACVNPFYPASGGGGGSANPFSPVPGGSEGSVNPYGGYAAGLYKDNGGTWEPVPSVLPNNLVSAFSHVNDPIVSGGFLVIINEDISLTATQSLTSNTLIVATGESIQITNPPGAHGGGIFKVNNGAKLTLEHSVTLRSHPDENNSSMVWVGGTAGGTFVMKGGSKITGHTRTDIDGGSAGGVAVMVDVDGINKGTFSMEGGEISGNHVRTPNNTHENGGAVQVRGGIFTMEGGVIIDNSADDYGSGVLVMNGGTFTMNSGTIARNTSGQNGGGVSVRGSSLSTFTMSGGIIYGNSATDSGARGGGVCCDSSQVFTKTGNSVIYGSDESGLDKDGRPLKNSTGAVSGSGHAAYTYTLPTGYRDITAGAGENLNSTSLVSPPWNM